MGTFTGPQAKGAKATARRLRRDEAERRNALTPNSRRKSWRDAQAKRQQRPRKDAEPQLLTECPWPWKVPYPTAEAAETALSDRQRNHGGGWLTAVTYDCPTGAHAHIGHPTAPDQRDQAPADSEAA